MSAPPLTPQPHAAPVESPPYYVLLPRRLVEDLRDSPVAIGAYALIARIYRATQIPVPLSPGDLQTVDPALSYGAATRALQRLAADAYVSVTRARGRKSVYTPTWGAVRGRPHPWDLAAPCLGRPRHVPALRLDQRMLDTCVGRVRPHADHPAIVDSYFSQPLLSLEDIGRYALALAGLDAASAQLRSLGLIDAGGRALPLPEDAVIFAVVSQRALDGSAGAVRLTHAGWERTAFLSAPSAPSTGEQALFFVPRDQIAHLIGSMIAHPITSADHHAPVDDASRSPISPPAQEPAGSHGVMGKGEKHSTTAAGGGEADSFRFPVTQSETPDPGGSHLEMRAQESESLRLLRSIGVRRSVAQQLEARPAEQVARVIAEARERGDVRSMPAWVVSALRDLPETPLEASPPPRVSDKAILLHPGVSPRERQVWLQRFRSADAADRPAVLARFHQEVAHAALP